MTDLFELCHSRWALGSLVVANVSQDTLDTVKTRYNRGRISPTNIHLETIQAPELLSQEPERAKNYVREHFSHPDSPFIPCFYTVIDERTAQDGSILYVQQDWSGEPDNFVRTMPEHAHFLTTGFLMGDDDWERVHEEDHNDNNVPDLYNPTPPDPAAPMITAIVRIPASLANLSGQDSDDVRSYDLEPQAAEQLGLTPGDRARTVKQVRRDDCTFGDNLYLEVRQRDIVSPSDDLRVWGTADFFRWGVDSAL
ncbi:hypothetical protein GALMADRAFT_254052 [Galerina marginata CBS 339.88]|uniref:Uncharacterized protein n=1 Tax=Galerina marginata (strain CBS 339.88) TaxID=685588 RepID=A0A067SMG6_GALM3|nr:hypothetical protein GALMADRAFT_254052 [Galerina marginata CBS 339.88]